MIRVDFTKTPNANNAPCFLEDAYDFLLVHDEIAHQTCTRQNRCMDELRQVWPVENEDHLEAFVDAILERESYELQYAYARGVQLAYQKHFKLPHFSPDTPVQDLLGEVQMRNEDTYISLCDTVTSCYHDMEAALHASERLADLMAQWCECWVQSMNFQRNYCFIFGLEYGLFQSRLLQKSPREDDEYVETLYRHLKIAASDNDPLDQ